MKKFSASKLAKTVRAKRKEKGLTQEQLSELTDINRVMIGRIERERLLFLLSLSMNLWLRYLNLILLICLLKIQRRILLWPCAAKL